MQNQMSSETEQDTAGDEQAIRKVIEALQNATARKDVLGVLATFADASTMFVLNPPLMFAPREKKDSADGLQKWFDSWSGNLDYFSRDLSVHCSGELALVFGLTYMGGKRTDGTKTDMWFRETFGLNKIDGEWKIMHQHQSVPIKMDGSGQAAMDLKPESH